MCIFCGDLSDPFHGLGPAPLMVGTVFAGRAGASVPVPGAIVTVFTDRDLTNPLPLLLDQGFGADALRLA